ncbi:16S rRNA (guanine(966)-N(2))-methyltransferase RsmD [Spiroplasma sp. BIUS-1]|uniref:16S rRNA (guanine(966)-N(2))-methyltransferase RsmD n=1 Tax=Spiroplasma sp. BIUS-1 TaxID=216964 RepID=UPI001397D4FB|nr:16S rRNA (guanine(966)-N(2))-methyltransferase RsmD [Spiroplasma sp. BIUS-1]QHX36928.1 16S rRNA (guanine966-N2)-methyltransferase [Spiroplasma sp. BIUS-1]
MRVISGRFRGRKLVTLEGMNTRPTITRVKEDMFNVLNNYFVFENKVCLDLFGGSGALSLEALSRGIGFAYVNDHYKPALEIIKQNFKGLEKDEFELFNLDYKRMLDYLVNSNKKMDLIFFDPPFAKVEYYYEFFKYIYDNELLNNYGILIMESELPLDMSKIAILKLLKYKDFKNKHLYILRREKGDLENE